ncbi:MAG: hypothetical protein KAH01_05820 [Caldisericia bacterium]|nr:hypothetical protein [Caldisericia bacterium]
MINVTFGVEEEQDEIIAVYDLVSRAYPKHNTYSITFNTKNNNVLISYMTPKSSKMCTIKIGLLELAKLAYKEKVVVKISLGDLNRSLY